MKKLLLLLVLGLTISTISNAQWQTLFNGKNLKGWKQLNGQAEYKVEDGTIVGTAVLNTPNSFLTTEKNYGDFIFECDVMLEQRTNSGIQFRSESLKEYNNGRVHGYQFEVDPSERAWSGGIYDEARRGWIYPLTYNEAARPAFKFKEWNKVRIECIGSSIRTWLNGVPCADILDNKTLSGFIALQVHSIKSEEMVGARIRWRNIRICTTNLDAEKTPQYGSIPQMNYLDNTLSAYEESQGWKLLFDGKSMDQWVSPTKGTFPAQGYDIVDGELLVNAEKGKRGGDIMTKKRYGNFELVFDFCISEKGNNGIKYNYQTQVPEKNAGFKGPEYQVLDNTGHGDSEKGSFVGVRQLGSLYDILQPVDTKKIFKGVNQWNKGKIVMQDGIVQHWLNGTKILEYDRFSYMYEVLRSYGKFKECEKFGQFPDGHLLITDHADLAKYKNIKVREL